MNRQILWLAGISAVACAAVFSYTIIGAGGDLNETGWISPRGSSRDAVLPERETGLLKSGNHQASHEALSQPTTGQIKMTTEQPIEIDVQSTSDLLQQHSRAEFLLLDCREPDEHKTCRIEGAMLMPMRSIPERLKELEAWKEQPLVVHCHHGGRSLQVVQFLRENGFPQARNMTGGIDVWSQEVDESVPRY